MYESDIPKDYLIVPKEIENSAIIQFKETQIEIQFECTEWIIQKPKQTETFQ